MSLNPLGKAWTDLKVQEGAGGLIFQIEEQGVQEKFYKAVQVTFGTPRILIRIKNMMFNKSTSLINPLFPWSNIT